MIFLLCKRCSFIAVPFCFFISRFNFSPSCESSRLIPNLKAEFLRSLPAHKPTNKKVTEVFINESRHDLPQQRGRTHAA